jgi:hypothetical protein
LHEQMYLTAFGERSDRGKPKVFRGSAHNLGLRMKKEVQSVR